MWNIEYLDANGKGYSDTEPWVEEGIDTEDALNVTLEGLRREGYTNIKVINVNRLGCDCCSGDEAVFWENGENNAFIVNKGEMLIMVEGVAKNFKVKFCPCCGKEFE